MNGKDILNTVESLTNESGLEKDSVFKALELSLAVAAKKDYKTNDSGKIDLVVKIDHKTGSYSLNRRWTVVDDNEVNFDAARHLYEDQAEEKYNKPFSIGDEVVEFISQDTKLSRISAQVFKQSIKENMRNVVKDNAQKKFKDSVGEFFKVKVSKFSKGDVFVSLNESVEGIIKKEDLQRNDRFEIGKPIDVVLSDVVDNYKGHQLLFSRTSDAFVRRMFEKEIPDILDENLEIKAFSRVKYKKTIVAVKGLIPHIDAVASCIGPKANRIKNIRNLVGGEAIEIVEWNSDKTQFLLNILGNKAQSILHDEYKNEFDIGLKDEALFSIKDINVEKKLIEDLISSKVNFYSSHDLDVKQENVYQYYIDLYKEKLDIDEDFAMILIEEGFDTFESLAYSPVNDFLEIEGFDEDLANEIKNRAKKVLEVNETNHISEMKYVYKDIADIFKNNGINSVEELSKFDFDELKKITSLRSDQVYHILEEAKTKYTKPEMRLENFKELNEENINTLNRNGIFSIEDLAYLSIDELKDIISINDDSLKSIIIKSKEIVF